MAGAGTALVGAGMAGVVPGSIMAAMATAVGVGSGPPGVRGCAGFADLFLQERFNRLGPDGPGGLAYFVNFVFPPERRLE